MLAGILLGCALASGAAQVPVRDPHAPARSASTGVIRGRVVTADATEAAVRSARVTLNSNIDAIEPTFTDADGRFEFTAIPAGRYTLTAQKTGFAAGRYGARGELDVSIPIDLAAGTVVDHIVIPIARGAAIEGRIVDDGGDPVVGAMVSVGTLRRVGDQSRFITLGHTASTDDRGMYRIGGLTAGRYYVAVESAREGAVPAGGPQEWGRPAGYGRTFYFGAESLAGATPIVLAAAEERTAIDIAVMASRPAKLTVTLTDASGAPASGMVNLILPGDTPSSILSNLGVPLSKGNPKMTAVVEPGRWTAAVLDSAHAIGHVTVSSGEEASLALRLGPGARISGRVVFDGTTAPPSGVRLTVFGIGSDAMLPPPALSNGAAAVRNDGTFEITGVVGTIVLQPPMPLRGWMLKAITYRGRNLVDDPLVLNGDEDIADVEVVFTDQIVNISGTATRADGDPSPGCTVALVPDGLTSEAESRRARLVRADQNGRFAMESVPAGSYAVAATPDVDADAWLTSAYSSRIRAVASRITVGRESQTLTLRCEPIP